MAGSRWGTDGQGSVWAAPRALASADGRHRGVSAEGWTMAGEAQDELTATL